MSVATPSDLEASFAHLQREARNRYRSWPAADVDDALQEAMEELLRRPREIESTLRSYVLVAVRNRLLNTTRGIKSVALNAPEAQEMIERDALDSSEELVHERQIASIVQHAIRHDLDREETRVLQLILANEDPRRNIGEDRVARALGKSRSQARKLIERVSDKLRVLLAGRLDDDALEQVPCNSPEGVSLVTAYAMVFWPDTSPRYRRAVAHLSSCRPCRLRAEQVRAGMRHGALVPGPVALGLLEQVYGSIDTDDAEDLAAGVFDRILDAAAAVRRQILDWFGASKVTVTNHVAQNAGMLPAMRPGAALGSGLVVCLGAVCVTSGVIPTPDIATGSDHPTQQERRLDMGAADEVAQVAPGPTIAQLSTHGSNGERIALAAPGAGGGAVVPSKRRRSSSSTERAAVERYRAPTAQAPATTDGSGDPSDPLSGGGGGGSAPTSRSAPSDGGGGTVSSGNPVDPLSGDGGGSSGGGGGGGSTGGGTERSSGSGSGGGSGGDPSDPLSGG